ALDPENGSVERISVAYVPCEIAANPETQRIYVADQAARELTVIDAPTQTVLAHITRQPGNADAGGITAGQIGVSIAMNRILPGPSRNRSTQLRDDRFGRYLRWRNERPS